MKKILVSDYDDTFYINDEDIKNNIILIDKYQDKLDFIIATGRSYHDYLKKKEKYNIKSKYVILNHGATIIEDDKILFNQEIDNKIKDELIDDLNIFESKEFFCCSGLNSRVSYQEKNLTKIHINYGDEIITKNKYNELKIKYSKYINCFLVSKNKAIEIVGKNVDKKNAILNLLEKKDLDINNVYTVGNGDTDYEMLKYFIGYKMNECSDKLKKLNIKSVASVGDLIEMIVN